MHLRLWSHTSDDAVATTARAEGGEAENSVGTVARGRTLRRRAAVASLLAVILLTSFWNLRQLATLWRTGAILGDGVSGETLAQLGSQSRHGPTPFDLSNATVPKSEIYAGGPPKDGIPAISKPSFMKGRDARHLRPSDRVVGFAAGDQSRAYPLTILNYHEIVNDTVADQPIAVTYCPLCDSAAVLDRQTPIGLREFGVSGLLYNSNVLMYDRGGVQEGLWSQLKREGISGPAAEVRLRTLPVELVPWQEWLARYPDTQVLTHNTGHTRDYARDPYAGYFSQPGVMFPVRAVSDRLPTKERVLGVWSANGSKAYPVSAFSRDRTRAIDIVDGKRVEIEFHPASSSLRVVNAERGVEWAYSLWFAWHAMHPGSEVFE